MLGGHPSQLPKSGVEQSLLSRNLLSGAALDRIRRLASENGERVDRIAAKLGLISDADLAVAYAEHLDTRLLTAADLPTEPVTGGEISLTFLKSARLIPLAETETTLTVAMADPLDETTVRALTFSTDKQIIRQVAVPTDIEAALERLYGTATTVAVPEPTSDEDRDTDLERLKDLASEAPVIRLVNNLIVRAVEMRASDIHIEVADSQLRVRYRIDGSLHDQEVPSPRLRAAIVSRIKIMARLNIAERRLPRDGRIRLAVRGKEIDFRVSVIPAIHGESVVLRVLDRGAIALDFASIGFDSEWLPTWLGLLRRTDGIILVTGPTSSGKTTTLYASLNALNDSVRKILTVEDPVEYVIEGITQVQVSEAIGLTFASALRSFLRHNPNIMMIGEIRDPETARIAIQMSLSGHTVLLTVHTNDTASAMTRLLDMEIEDYPLTSTIRGVLAQRLVRRLCDACKQPFVPGPDDRAPFA